MAEVKLAYIDMVIPGFTEQAEVIVLGDRPVVGYRLPREQRPGFMVTSRKRAEAEDDMSIGQAYAYGITLFFEKELPDNRFLFRFGKNGMGLGCQTVPVVKRFLDDIGPGHEFVDDGQCGALIVDIVGMIYIKSNYP